MERKIQPWQPAEALNEAVRSERDEAYEQTLAEWRRETGTPAGRERADQRFAEYWTEDRKRRFAIDSGEIEGLYRLRSRAKERLVRTGLEHAREEDQIERVHSAQRLRTLLLDELNALRRMAAHAKTGAPLTIEEIQAWHREATRHQEERLVEVESDEGTLTRLRVPMVPGQLKEHENLIVSGHTEYEFCPPERARTELEKIVGMDRTHRTGPSSTAMCAAWMHAAFNSVHPFPDGNGRVGRLLMAWVYLRRNEYPPLIATEDRSEYFQAMREAHRGELEPLRTVIHESAAVMMELSLMDARDHGRRRNHGAGLNRGWER